MHTNLVFVQHFPVFPAFGVNNRTMKKKLLTPFLFITEDCVIGVFVFGGKSTKIYPQLWNLFTVPGKTPEDSSFL